MFCGVCLENRFLLNDYCFVYFFCTIVEDEINQYFPSKPITRTVKPDEHLKKSELTLSLEQAQLSGHLKRNKLFSDFAIYDGRMNSSSLICEVSLKNPDNFSNLVSRQFVVWFWRLTDFPRVFIKVQPRIGTTVKQFIGLCLWQYFNESFNDEQDSFRFTYLDELV